MLMDYLLKSLRERILLFMQELRSSRPSDANQAHEANEARNNNISRWYGRRFAFKKAFWFGLTGQSPSQQRNQTMRLSHWLTLFLRVINLYLVN